MNSIASPELKAEIVRDLLSGAEMVVRALVDQGVDILFGYPGGAVLPIYDALLDSRIRHILVRHEQGAAHAAEGYARTTGRPGVVLVTSGPGVTNIITGILDALMDSIPLVIITGQLPTHLIGTDAFQEADTVGITRSFTKHSFLVKRVEDLPRVMHEAFRIVTTGRPGPVVVDLPKDVQCATGIYTAPQDSPPLNHYAPQTKGDPARIKEAVELISRARRPLFYSGGGVVNAGPGASVMLRKFASLTGAPMLSTLIGLGAFPASSPQWLGMLGAYEANHAMHDCDVMICVGARFDDRVTGRLNAFSPRSKKIHINIDPSSIGKNVRADIGIVGDAASVLEDMVSVWKTLVHRPTQADPDHLDEWWRHIDVWRSRKAFAHQRSSEIIKPQFAIERLYALTREEDVFITTEMGRHHMWAAQLFHFDQPNRWMTSGGLGTMGYGLPAAIGVQLAHPNSLVIDIAGEASVLMNIQELSTAVQYQLPVKMFILTNQHMGMIRQWQQLLHGERYSHSYSESLPDFVALAKAYGAVGI